MTRFQREAEVLASLNHQNIAASYRFGLSFIRINERTKGGLRMGEIEDSLTALLSEFNTRTGRNIELLPCSTAPQDPAYVVFSLRDLSSDESRLLTLCIFDVVEPWGKVGLPEAVNQINDAVVNFWREGSREPNRTVYIPPKHDTADGSEFHHSQ